MIKRIKIRNFQCHENFSLDLSPRLNVLSGSSNKGKSAILRALRWIVFNRPEGKSFINHEHEKCTVSIYTKDHKIIRKRGKSENSYFINGKALKAFGSGVPEEVEKAFNLGPINFQSQHEAPFWFSLTPGQVSKEINQIVSLDLIDRVLSNLNSKVRQSKSELKVCEERLEEATKREKELSWVVQADKELKHIEEKELESTRSKISRGRDILGEINRERKISGGRVPIKEVLRMVETSRRLGETLSRTQDASRTIREIKLKREEACQLRKEAKILQKRLAELLKGTCPLCGRKN